MNASSINRMVCLMLMALMLCNGVNALAENAIYHPEISATFGLRAYTGGGVLDYDSISYDFYATWDYGFLCDWSVTLHADYYNYDGVRIAMLNSTIVGQSGVGTGGDGNLDVNGTKLYYAARWVISNAPPNGVAQKVIYYYRLNVGIWGGTWGDMAVTATRLTGARTIVLGAPRF